MCLSVNGCVHVDASMGLHTCVSCVLCVYLSLEVSGSTSVLLCEHACTHGSYLEETWPGGH